MDLGRHRILFWKTHTWVLLAYLSVCPSLRYQLSMCQSINLPTYLYIFFRYILVIIFDMLKNMCNIHISCKTLQQKEHTGTFHWCVSFPSPLPTPKASTVLSFVLFVPLLFKIHTYNVCIYTNIWIKSVNIHINICINIHIFKLHVFLHKIFVFEVYKSGTIFV